MIRINIQIPEESPITRRDATSNHPITQDIAKLLTFEMPLPATERLPLPSIPCFLLHENGKQFFGELPTTGGCYCHHWGRRCRCRGGSEVGRSPRGAQFRGRFSVETEGEKKHKFPIVIGIGWYLGAMCLFPTACIYIQLLNEWINIYILYICYVSIVIMMFACI